MAVATGKTTNKWIGLSACSLGAAVLSLPAIAMAQEEHHGNGNAAHPPAATHPAVAPQAGWHPPVAQARPAPANPAAGGWQSRPAQGGYAAGRPQTPAVTGGSGAWHNYGGQWQQAPGYGRPQPGGGPQGSGYARAAPGGQWNHSWRQDNRYDWRGWRDQNREAFHVGRYYAPYRGYYYSRIGVGFALQPLFFSQDYWITDPWDYHLPPAYAPFQWVRYYNDVLLVNTYNGQVADVIYDFFW